MNYNKFVNISENITLIVEESPELRRFYGLNLKVWVGTQIIFASDAKEALKLLQSGNINLVISKLIINESPCSEIIYKAINDNNLPIKLINISSKKLNSEVINLSSGLDIRPLIKASAKLLEVTPEQMAKLSVPEYFEIDIEYFTYLPRSVTNVYVQEDERYEIIIDELKDYPKEFITKLSETHSKLYVKREERLKFVTNLTSELGSQIPTEKLNKSELLRANEMSHGLLSDKLRQFGITKETIELSKRNIKNMVESTRRFPNLGKLVQNLLRNRSSYLYQHTQVLMYICSHLMDNIDWGNEEQKKKINFVCFFHDIVLKSDEQAMIYTEDELKRSKLKDEDKDLVNKHAQLAAEIVHKYPHAPMGADVIIRQHHGVSHGIGFAESFTANLSPMTIVFILAENFTDSLIREEDSFNLKSKINQMRERFSTQRFQKIIDVLEKVTL